MADPIRLPVALSFVPGRPGETRPGRGEAGWTIYQFKTIEDRNDFMRRHPEAAMPAWKRINVTEENKMATRRMQARRATPKGRGGSSGGGNPRSSREISEQQHDDAMRVLRAEYYQGVRSIAQSVIERVAEGEEESDVIHEEVDGSYWVIYTHANFQVLMCSDHHDAYSEEYGEVPVSGSDVNWAALAYAAMARDVSEQVAAGGTVDEAPRRGVRPGARRPVQRRR